MSGKGADERTPVARELIKSSSISDLLNGRVSVVERRVMDKEERFGVSSEFDSDEEEAADLREAVLTLGELGNDGQCLRRQ